LGGQDNILEKFMTVDYDTGIATITFRRAINTGDIYDHPFRVDQQVIFAFHPTQTAYAYHGPLRSPNQYVDWFVQNPGPAQDTFSLRAVIQAILALAAAVVVFFYILLLINANDPRIRYASFIFLQIILVGTLCAYASVLVSTFNPTTTLCQLKFGLMSAAYVMVYGSIMAKTWRIHRIFNGASQVLEKVSITNATLLAYLFVVAFCDFLIFAIWNIVTPMTVQLVTSSGGTGQIPVCASENDTGLAVYLAFKALVLLYGCYLSVVVRGVDSRFNESVSLATSIYITFTIGVVVILLGFFLADFPNAPLVLHAVGLVFPFTFTIYAQFLPKYYMIYFNKEFTSASVATSRIDSGSAGGKGSVAMSAGSHASHANSHSSSPKTSAIPKSDLEDKA